LGWVGGGLQERGVGRGGWVGYRLPKRVRLGWVKLGWTVEAVGWLEVREMAAGREMGVETGGRRGLGIGGSRGE
jgi:hypothetical protein